MIMQRYVATIRALHPKATAVCSASWHASCAAILQGLRSLEMINVVGAYPTETEELLSALRGLTSLRIQNNTAAVKMAPMHCLTSMPLLQVPCLVTIYMLYPYPCTNK